MSRLGRNRMRPRIRTFPFPTILEAALHRLQEEFHLEH